jgi:hypothetical protein
MKSQSTSWREQNIIEGYGLRLCQAIASCTRIVSYAGAPRLMVGWDLRLSSSIQWGSLAACSDVDK